MKRLLKSLLMISVLLMLAFPALALPPSDGDCTISQKIDKVRDTHGNLLTDAETRRIVFTCTGDSTDGSVPNTEISASDLNFIRGWYLYRVEVYPTSGGTPPTTGADVFILDGEDMDLLGSEDGGTTAYNGLNLVHATLKRTCMPNMYLPRDGSHVNYFWDITDFLTLKVSGQTDVSANYTVELFFRLR